MLSASATMIPAAATSAPTTTAIRTRSTAFRKKFSCEDSPAMSSWLASASFVTANWVTMYAR
jgi:hypothetical protein